MLTRPHGTRLFTFGLMAAALGFFVTPAAAQRVRGEERVDPPASAALSPDGLRAAWVTDKGRSIVSATRAGKDTDWSAPNRLLTTRGAVHTIVFSPDSKSLAYENSRAWKDDGTPDDSWEFICVYDIASRQISTVDPSFDTDSDPVWSPDGMAITFTRKAPGWPTST